MTLFPSLTKRDKGLGELDSFNLSSNEGFRALGYVAGTAPLPSAKLSFSTSFSVAGSPAQAAGDLSFEIDFAAESSAASAVAATGSFSMSASLTAAAAVVEEGAASLSASFALSGESVGGFPVTPLVSFDVDKEPTQSDGTTAPALTNQEGAGTLTVTSTPEYRTSVFPNGQPSVYYGNGERHSSDGSIPDMTSSGGLSFQIAIHVEATTGRLLFGFTSNLGSSSWATWAAGGGFLAPSFPGNPVYLHNDSSPGLDAGLANAITSNQSYVYTYKQDGSGNYRIKLNNTTVTGSDSPVAAVSSSDTLHIGDWPAVIAPNMHVGQYHYWPTELSDADQDDIHDITMDILGIT